MQDEIQKCYEAIKHLVEGKELTVETILDVVTPAMEMAEQALDGGLSGQEKLGIVMGAVRILIQESPLKNKEELLRACEQTIPNTIKLIVRASKGELSLNAQTVGGCLSCFGIVTKTIVKNT